MLMSLAIGGPFPLPFIRRVSSRPVNSNDPDTNRISTCVFKFLDLTNEVANYTVDLLYHGFCEDLRFRSNLDVCDFPACHEQTSFGDCYSGRHQFPKRSITAATRPANSFVRE